MERATGGIPGIVCVFDLSDATEAYKPLLTRALQAQLVTKMEEKI